MGVFLVKFNDADDTKDQTINTKRLEGTSFEVFGKKFDR